MSENAIGMALGMLAIATTWGAALVTCAGLGLGLLRCLRLERSGSEGLFAAVWVGWATALGALQIWQLFHPMDVWARVLLVALGAAGVVWNWSTLAAGLRLAGKRVLPLAAAAVLLALWLANRAMASEMHPDAGLYHLSTVRWLSEYPIVPGLGNLNWRLAFNSSYFLFMAAMEFGPWAYHAQHVAVYFLILTLGLQVGWSAYSVLLGGRPASYQALFRVALIPAIVRKMWAGIHEVEPDLAIWVLAVVIVDQLIRLVEDNHRGKDTSASVLLVSLVSSAAVAVRLSAAGMGLVALVVALALRVRTKDKPTSVQTGVLPVLPAIVLSGLLIAVWVFRGYLLSGYPVFPSTIGGVGVDWRVPSSMANNEARWIMSWARSPGEVPDVVLKDWAWLGPWLKNLWSIAPFDIVAPLAIAVVAFLVALARRHRWEPQGLGLASVATVPLLSLVFWFLTAPDPRFAGSAAWLLAGCGLLLAFGGSGARESLWFSRGLLLVAVVAAVAPHLTAPNHISPGPEKGFYGLPHVSVVEVTLPSGLTYLRPTAAMDNQCWDAPLPCAPYPPDDLQLRVPGDLSRGFKVSSADGG